MIFCLTISTSRVPQRREIGSMIIVFPFHLRVPSRTFMAYGDLPPEHLDRNL